MNKLQFIIQRAVRNGRVRNDLVLCDNCDNPASRQLSLAMSWTGCGPCMTGEADSLDDGDFIAVPKAHKRQKGQVTA